MEIYSEHASIEVTAEVAAPTLEVDVPPGRQASLWRDATRRLVRNKLAMCGLVGVTLLVLLAIFADKLMPYPYDFQNFEHINEAPSWDFPLGTDLVGRDMLSRMIYGARVSMTVSFVAQLVILLIALPIGALAGYKGGWTDLVIMRVVDVFYAIPSLLLAILLMSILGRGIENLFLALIATGWLTITRLTRAQMLGLREKEYVKAARVSGANPLRIVLRHMLPNALTPIVVAVTFGIPQLIFAEAALSFIGIGIDPPMPSWGQMVGEFQQYLRSSWWLAAFPSAAIAVTMLSFTFLGDGIRDALDPRMND
jgi:oligopeptide transport system permease protein